MHSKETQTIVLQFLLRSTGALWAALLRGAPALRSTARPAALPVVLALAVAAGSTGCSLPYYAQALSGQWRLLHAARPVDDWLGDPATPPELKAELERARRIRRYASASLGLANNRSYTLYADLHRDSAVWNVFAAPELSLSLKAWCYPILGCAGYRGYFARQDAAQLAAALTSAGWDATVVPVAAYSTLGWFADPLLNTFVGWPELELARLIFHELAHQVIYVRDDTRFNESFATTVERAGLARWVDWRGDPQLRDRYRRYLVRQQDFHALIAQTRGELERIYATDAPVAQQRARKRAAFAALQEHYLRARDARWEDFHGYDAFFAADWNNARIAALAAYQDDVPAFEALLARGGGNLPRFYAAVKALATLEPAQRRAAMQALGPAAAN